MNKQGTNSVPYEPLMLENHYTSLENETSRFNANVYNLFEIVSSLYIVNSHSKGSTEEYVEGLNKAEVTEGKLPNLSAQIKNLNENNVRFEEALQLLRKYVG